MKIAGRDAGLMLDPVYTGKAMAGLIQMITDGDIKRGSSVAFVHTGGVPGILQYSAGLAERL